jgi:hypothetical protein
MLLVSLEASTRALEDRPKQLKARRQQRDSCDSHTTIPERMPSAKSPLRPGKAVAGPARRSPQLDMLLDFVLPRAIEQDRAGLPVAIRGGNMQPAHQ